MHQAERVIFRQHSCLLKPYARNCHAKAFMSMFMSTFCFITTTTVYTVDCVWTKGAAVLWLKAPKIERAEAAVADTLLSF